MHREKGFDKGVQGISRDAPSELQCFITRLLIPSRNRYESTLFAIDHHSTLVLGQKGLGLAREIQDDDWGGERMLEAIDSNDGLSAAGASFRKHQSCL